MVGREGYPGKRWWRLAQGRWKWGEWLISVPARRTQWFWPEQLEGWCCHYLRWGSCKGSRLRGVSRLSRIKTTISNCLTIRWDQLAKFWPIKCKQKYCVGIFKKVVLKGTVSTVSFALSLSFFSLFGMWQEWLEVSSYLGQWGQMSHPSDRRLKTKRILGPSFLILWCHHDCPGWSTSKPLLWRIEINIFPCLRRH